ncbi:MAG TPA: Xaa-Pro peptidase family protein [Gemmatimonadaceae bacterium]|nr:Xaa-Pro peptidase family protein [Gemmatimonadaceae bacterium]
MLSAKTLPAFQKAIAAQSLDGWLLYDFRGVNPIAAGLIGLEGMVTRRVFAFIPREGTPVAITHAIEQAQWAGWPAGWGREVYSSWRALEEALGRLVRGKRVAMEYSPGDAVPYVDRIPAGVLDMVRAAGAEVVTSGELVSRFYAIWTPAQLASHRRAAEVVAEIGREALAHAGAGAGSLTEYDVMRWILERFERAGLETDHGPNVSVGPNAANPHYEPTADVSRRIERGDVLLIDLWAKEKGADGGIWADQTWMASLGAPTARAQEVWGAIRDARDAAIALLRERVSAGAPVRGGDVDDASRRVIESRGLGRFFTHRTGHSIDSRDLHGSGPHLDNLETRDERLLIPGVAFSIEPGVYVAGEIGMRTEVNAFVGEGEVVVTPVEYQRELMVV